ncbi:MAG: hypothetical protein IPO18_08245 [bacterium]|nr:hypothetical protein [bacterium]
MAIRRVKGTSSPPAGTMRLKNPRTASVRSVCQSRKKSSDARWTTRWRVRAPSVGSKSARAALRKAPFEGRPVCSVSSQFSDIRSVAPFDSPP